MATIQEDIEAIQNAIYGRETREPISDVLEKKANDVSREFSKPIYIYELQEYKDHTQALRNRMDNESPWDTVSYSLVNRNNYKVDISWSGRAN